MKTALFISVNREDGVVHFSESPPDEAEAVEVETLITAKPPPYVPPAQPVVKARTVSEMDDEHQSAQPEIESPPLARKTDITEMSLADLDRRCEDVREKMIAPLREAEIAKCKQQEDTDPALWRRRTHSNGWDFPKNVSRPSGMC